MTFSLHEKLEQDTLFLGRFELCRLLLMNDKQFPWLILVPEVDAVSEIYQLTSEQQRLLIAESSFLAERIATLFKADKMNVAAIGNLVPQLHIHHVARFRTDKAWPAPIWGKFPTIPYSEQEKAQTIGRIIDAVNLRM